MLVKSRIVMILEGDEFVEGFLTECDGINSEGAPRATQTL